MNGDVLCHESKTIPPRRKGMTPPPSDPDEVAYLATLVPTKPSGERNASPQSLHQSRAPKVCVNIMDPIHETVRLIDKTIGEKTRAGEALLFRQNGRLVHITDKAGKEPAGISIVNQSSLPVLLSPHITFFEIKETKTGRKIVDLAGCSQEFAKRFLSDAQKGKSSIPELAGICTMPTIRSDGTVVQNPRYDEGSGLFLIFDQEFPPVPDSPSREEAQEALDRLFIPFREFPFDGAASKSSYLSMLFSAVVRRALRSAPAGLIDAPDMGTGKSLLTWSVGYIATGKSVKSMTFPYSQNEQKKTIFAALLAGASIIAFDNVDVPIKGAALCTAITEEVYSDRVLGVSETASAPCGAVIMLNGNNVSVEADMSVRVIPCTLDAGVEDPHLRQFELDVKEYIRENRAQMVVDILTIIRAYLSSGDRIPPASRFSDWSHFVREPLIWVGEEDPMHAAEGITKRDPVRSALVDVLECLEKYYGLQPFLARDAVTSPMHNDPKGRAKYILLEALEAAVTTSATELNARSCGRYFMRFRGRVVNGRRLVNTECKKDNHILWAIEKVGPGGEEAVEVIEAPKPQPVPQPIKQIAQPPKQLQMV